LQAAAYIRDADLRFKSSKVRVVAHKNHPKIELVGLTIGPLKEGESYELPLWVALELGRRGITRVVDDCILDPSKLHKIHWREKMQSPSSLSALPQDFYPKLRLLISELRARADEGPEGAREYVKVLNYSKDIVNCRVRKVVSMALARVEPTRALRNLTVEERMLYEEVRRLVEEWRRRILEVK